MINEKRFWTIMGFLALVVIGLSLRKEIAMGYAMWGGW